MYIKPVKNKCKIQMQSIESLQDIWTTICKKETQIEKHAL